MRKMLLGAGSAALLVGALAIASGVMSPGTVQAGQSTVPTPACDSTATPVNTSTPTVTATPTLPILTGRVGGGEVVFASFPQGNGQVIPTCTPTSPAHTHTPTPSRTPEDTATPPPTTPVPTDTPAPQGTPGGGAIEPPSTGTGSSGSGVDMMFIAVGAALVALGGAGIAFGLKRR